MHLPDLGAPGAGPASHRWSNFWESVIRKIIDIVVRFYYSLPI